MARLNDTKIPITDFLDAYRRQPCLYNSVLDTYKNRVAREQAYEAIIKTLQIPQLTVLDIKLKIKSVRTVYTKELRILLREKQMGRSYEPKLFWFKRADAFLRSVSLSHCSKRVKDSNETIIIKKEAFNVKAALIEDELQQQQQQQEHQQQQEQQQEEDEEGSENEACMSPKHLSTATNTTNVQPNVGSQTLDDSSMCILEEQQQQPHPPQHPQQHQPILRKLRYMPYTPIQPSPTQPADLSCSSSSASICFANSNTTTDDDLIIFGQSIASQLRSIPDPYSRSVAKLRIQQVLFEAETGQSSESVNPQLPSFCS
ncbi:hypothetical protein KR093_000677 [Drosophila rubida]|uniref:MADF domain-containing protein n=1 Tax=Drosophila rubida TaxID=30044 RepID=A0AAD4K8R4_9MUSC|nr:hypothetical protein KR093_000677 [Drosophila rubida]